jgi:8-oxo-dGTP diphosphatase
LPIVLRAFSNPELTRAMTTTHHAAGPANQPATPGLFVSVVLFRLHGGELEVNLVGEPQRTLPAGPPGPDESLDTAARRIVRQVLHTNEEYMEQLYTFSPANEAQRTVIISYLALLQPQDDACDVSEGLWRGVLGVNLANEADQAVLDYALIRLRAKLGYTNIAFHLLPEMFTLSELQRAYESILLHPVDKRNFRRRILASGILSQTDEKRRDGSHRPAALYRFASREDHTTYLTPPQPGTNASPRQESSR